MLQGFTRSQLGICSCLLFLPRCSTNRRSGRFLRKGRKVPSCASSSPAFDTQASTNRQHPKADWRRQTHRTIRRNLALGAHQHPHVVWFRECVAGAPPCSDRQAVRIIADLLDFTRVFHYLAHSRIEIVLVFVIEYVVVGRQITTTPRRRGHGNDLALGALVCPNFSPFSRSDVPASRLPKFPAPFR